MSGDEISVGVLPKDGVRALDELRGGVMVAARSKDDFLYILDHDGEFHMFSHTVGAAGGGQKRFPKNEKYEATIRRVVELADAVFAVTYDKGMNVYGVMATAEDAVLGMFPSVNRDADADVEFISRGERES